MQDPMAGLTAMGEEPEGAEEDSPFPVADFDPNPKRDDDGKFASKSGGESKKDNTSAENNGNVFIAKPGENFNVKYLPEIRDGRGRVLKPVSDEVEHVAIFAGKDTESLVKKQAALQKEHKGATAADWQKASGRLFVEVKNDLKEVEIHWFQHPDVGFAEVRFIRYL